MKLIIAVALALVAVAIAAPADPAYEPSKILKSEENRNPDGTYEISFETEDGTFRKEVAELKEVVGEDNKPVKVLTVRGFYSYINEDGTPVKVEYEGDEFGFRAVGDHIPKPEGVSRR